MRTSGEKLRARMRHVHQSTTETTYIDRAICSTLFCPVYYSYLLQHSHGTVALLIEVVSIFWCHGRLIASPYRLKDSQRYLIFISTYLFDSETLRPQAYFVCFDHVFTFIFPFGYDAFIAKLFSVRTRTTDFLSTLSELRLHGDKSERFWRIVRNIRWKREVCECGKFMMKVLVMEGLLPEHVEREEGRKEWKTQKRHVPLAFRLHPPCLCSTSITYNQRMKECTSTTIPAP